MRFPQQRLQKLSLALGIAVLLSGPVCVFYLGPPAAAAYCAILVFALVIRRLFVGALADYRDEAAKANRRVAELSTRISDQNRTAQLLLKSEKQLRDTFEFAPIGMSLVSPSKQLIRVNRALAEIFGCNAEDLLDTVLLSHVVPEDADSVEVNLGRLLDGTDPILHSETRVYRKNGAICWLGLSVSLVRDISNDPSHFVLQCEDITDRRMAEDRLLHNTLHDFLTDLPNRFLFLDRLQVAVHRFRCDPGSRLAVLHVDFDRFKLVNDRFGQQAADQVLIQASERLRRLLRATNTVSRLGADEFAILVEDAEFEEMLSIVMRVREQLSRPYVIDQDQIYATVSVGIAIATPAYDSAEFLLRDANTALIHAKQKGRDRYEIFVDKMHSSSVQFLEMETDLRHALERNEIKLFYQPIVTLETGILAGFESLVRWEHPVRGLISPVEFIPIAEDTGMIVQIGEWILRESCRQLRSWQTISDRSADLWVSVNVSSKQFVEVDLISLVASALTGSGLEPHYLKLEITETMMVENIEEVAPMMEQLKQMGVKISIDDFGTGFSSLSVLDSLPLDSLKIDRSFVSQIKHADTIVEMLRTIVNLARTRDLEIIAEGVETIEQLSQLRHLGCQFGQGYCFAMPLEAETVDELLGDSSLSSALSYLLPTASQILEPLELG